MNKAWFKCFLFQIFFQNAIVQPQIKVESIAIRNDMRTAKILDLFVQMKSKCFILEETMICTGKEALEKLIFKKYYEKAIEVKLPYMLIGVSVCYSAKSLEDISIAFIVNKTTGNVTVVKVMYMLLLFSSLYSF